MTTDQVLSGVGLILVLAVGSQVLASRLRIPGLIILLPAGFTAGALTTDVNPERLLGASFEPLVSLAGLRWWARCCVSSVPPSASSGYWPGRGR